MFDAKIIPASKLITDINAETQRQPKLMATAMKRAGSRMRTRWLKRLRVEPRAAPPGITRYMTPKQRRKVHALRRERGGGSYERSHDLINDWDVRVDAAEKGGAITVDNPNPVAEFVYGVRRQPFIEVIGWLDPVPMLDEFWQEANTVIEETFFTISDPVAGVRR